MRRRYDHVSAKRALSGPGLVNLYNILCELDGVPAAPFTPAQIADRQIGEREPHAREALEMFCAMLGTVAGNLALILGARGGVYIAGGIVPRQGTHFSETQFRARFEAKGRFQPYLAAIPTYVISTQSRPSLGLRRCSTIAVEFRGDRIVADPAYHRPDKMRHCAGRWHVRSRRAPRFRSGRHVSVSGPGMCGPQRC